MFAYVKCWHYFAVYAEMSKNLGATPFFKINTCNSETIIDIPFCQIILTPGGTLAAETKYRNDAEQNKNIPAPPARTAKD